MKLLEKWDLFTEAFFPFPGLAWAMLTLQLLSVSSVQHSGEVNMFPWKSNQGKL